MASTHSCPHILQPAAPGPVACPPARDSSRAPIWATPLHFRPHSLFFSGRRPALPASLLPLSWIVLISIRTNRISHFKIKIKRASPSTYRPIHLLTFEENSLKRVLNLNCLHWKNFLFPLESSRSGFCPP